MYKVLVAEPISKAGLADLLHHPEFDIHIMTDLSQSQLLERIGEYDALIVRSQTMVTEELLSSARRLRVVARAGVGVDNIDIQAATRNGVIVINSPGANTIAAAEHTLAMMLALSRSIPRAHGSVSLGEWKRSSFQGVELYGKTLGIIGMGKIGTEVAKRAKAFQMNILGYDPFLTEERAGKLGAEKASIEEIAARSDFITVHTPLIPATKNLINRDFLDRAKPGVRIINCARGGIIDEDALMEALESGKAGGAALDVFSNEPPEISRLQHPNLITTPHLGASTIEAQDKVAQEISEEIIDILETRSVRNAVNMPQMSSETQKRLQPFLQLGEQAGLLAVQLLNSAPEQIDIQYAGNLVEEDTDLLSRIIMKGILSCHMSDSVNLVNAFHLLKEQGVTYNVQNNPATKGFENYLELKLVSGNHIAIIGATVLNGFGGRIVKMNDYRIDVRPEQHLLYIKHVDIPGMIGHVGSILGSHGINIGTMQVGRSAVGGEAIMILTLDKCLGKEEIDALRSIRGLTSIQSLELPDLQAASSIQTAIPL